MPLTASVVIDNYNYGRFLRQAIDSALAQTYPVEVVVVDDGSTDESREIIRSYGDKIRPVLKENGGQASAFNAGFAAARGDIVAFLDADDYYHPGKMERVVSVWKDATNILHHRLEMVDAAGKAIGYEPAADRHLDSGDVLPLELRSGVYCAPPTSGLVYRRAFLQRIMPMPEEAFRGCGDTYLIFRSPFLAPVVVLDEVLAFYRVHGANDYGTAAPSRRFWNPRRLERARQHLAHRHDFIRQLARDHGFAVPEEYAWRDANELLEELLLLRVRAAQGTRGRGGFLVGRILQRCFRRGDNRRQAWRAFLLSVAIWLGPRLLLRRIYPNLF